MKKMKKLASVCLSALMLTTALFATACDKKAVNCDHVYDAGRVTKNATCKAEGEKTFTCEKCRSTKTESIEKTTNHSFDYTQGVQTTAPTCQSEGVMTYTCTVCEEATDTSTIPAVDHSVVWNDAETVAPTCTDAGVKTGTCTLGGTPHTVTEDVPATGHHYTSGICSCDDVNGSHTWGDINTGWVLVKQATCTEKGLKKMVAIDDSKHFYTQEIEMREHTYANGICEVCQTPAEYPEAPAEITYKTPHSGSGSDYIEYISVGEDEVAPDPNTGRWECREGYYEITLNAKENWLSFSVSSIGQYALYSIENTNGVTLARYDASANYITPTPYPARTDDNGNVYSTVNCSQSYASENDLANWRATYKVSGKVGDVIKLRFVRIADAAWTPSYIQIAQMPSQIDGKADDISEEFAAEQVPYESNYFYDETDGYYYLGTKENKGSLIYVQLKEETRLLGDKAILELLGDTNGFLISKGQNPEGDYILYDYSVFFLKDHPNYPEPIENSYANYMNTRGFYPVNQELFTFLNDYVNTKGSEETWGVSLDKAWLAPCFYFRELEIGTEQRPYAITDLTTEKTVNLSAPRYFNLKYGKADYESNYRSSYVTITLSDPTAIIQIGNYNYTGSVTVESSAEGGVTFVVKKRGNPNEDVTVSFAEYTQGTYGSPNTITPSETAQTLTAQMLVTAEGVPTYSIAYLYTPTTEGNAMISVNGETSATVYVNAEAITETSVSVEVTGVTDEDTQETTYTPVLIYIEFPELEGLFIEDDFSADTLNVSITFTFNAN